MEDSQEDLRRKLEFWEVLDSIVEDRNNSKMMFLGDFNSRLSSSLDPDHSHIGPHVRGKGKSIVDHDGDSAEYLYSFMQGRDLSLRRPLSIYQMPGRSLIKR